MADRNFLLGKGERLTESVVVRGGGAPRQHPYTYGEAVERLSPQLRTAVEDLFAIPDAACPRGDATATFLMNPEYITKSYFPGNLLRTVGLQAIGSRPARLVPDKKSRGREPVEALTTELFVSGSRDSFRDWSDSR